MKRWNTIVVLGMVLGLLWNCGTTKSAEEIALQTAQFEALKELVAKKSIMLSAETAYPMQTNAVMRVNNALLRNTGNTAGRISLMGSGYFIKIKGDTVQAKLPYFGEVRVVSSLNPNDGGINFNGEPYSFEVTENEKKQNIKLEFDIKSKTEQFSVIIQMYPNKRATVFVNSMNRNSIRYDGSIKEIEEK